MSNRERRQFIEEELSPAYTTVYNPYTGEFHTASNNMAGERPDSLDPRLEDRIESMPQEVKNALREKEGGVGSHSEVYAVNDALRADPSVAIEDLVVDTRRTGIARRHPVGEGFPACAHCGYIIEGAHLVHGRVELEGP